MRSRISIRGCVRPSVRQSVRWSVCLSVRPSVTYELIPCKSVFFDQNNYQYVRERILWPCIRPCFSFFFFFLPFFFFFLYFFLPFFSLLSFFFLSLFFLCVSFCFFLFPFLFIKSFLLSSLRYSLCHFDLDQRHCGSKHSASGTSNLTLSHNLSFGTVNFWYIKSHTFPQA